MKKILTLFTFLLFTGTALVQAQTARVQVIHNSADAAASTVDVWLTAGGSSSILLDDFAFRTASPFVNAPAGSQISVGIAPSNSTMITDTIANFDLTLTDNATYIVVANGIVSATGYSPAPAFVLDIYAMGRESAATAGNTDVLVYHGSTDAPTVDVVEVGVGAGTIVDDASYNAFAGYLELGNADYSLQVRDQSGTTTVAQFDAPLQTLGLADSALVVLASGFLNPMMNSNGPAFGLYAALPTGGALVQLPSSPITTSRVQVIHNSADAAAATVDVWLDNTLLLDDFDFRTASPFVDAPAGTAFDVRIQPSTSTDTTNPIAKYTYTLMGGEKYILVANGIVSATGYSPAKPFNIEVFAGAKESSTTAGNVDILVFHGSTDAPTVDVYETTAGLLVDDLNYVEFAGYLDLPTVDYNLEIRDSLGSGIVAQFAAPLATLNLQDAALTVVASGFLDPGANSNGPAFGLYVASPAGGPLTQLPVITSIDDEVNANLGLSLFPNPASGQISVRFDLENNTNVSYEIADIFGKTLYSNSLGQFAVGNHTVDVNLNNLPTGMYILKVYAGEKTASRKMNVLR